ncbi:hypothetical protein SAMN04488061_3407 [Filomicrobium insigne]|uniref:Uncharacterized protein n=1 Tax=Filomicrobium insigne TaxID=418854 RepID=A0A1H0TWK7_9HYPH|nr:hypothetical protein [Filomicrobium insigne]SDP58349.1 hypothetical protein SAMN04488061_3407 [Filomicrobium insigne]
MASNFDCIGLGVTNAAELGDLVVRLAGEAGERLVTDAGEYAIWRSRTGAELWIHLGAAEDGEREIIGLTPFFEGRSEMSLDVERAITRPHDNAYEGAFLGAVRTHAGGQSPLIFDAVDFAAHSTRPLPARWLVRLTGFARRVDLLEEVGDHARGELAATGAATEGEATARVVGQIAGCETLINEATGHSFCWLFIDGADVSIDVVAPLDLLHGDIKLGGTVKVDCALFGRIID